MPDPGMVFDKTPTALAASIACALWGKPGKLGEFLHFVDMANAGRLSAG